jgi:tetratricopeptide (TPR) repeat protein
MAMSKIQKGRVLNAGSLPIAFGNSCDWVRHHWLDLLLPPMAFLLAAAVYQQLYYTRVGWRTDKAARHYEAALQAAKNEDNSTALRELLAASDLAPDDAAFHLGLSTGFHALGQKTRAARHLECGVRMQPPKLEAYLGVLRAYTDASLYADAERMLRQDLVSRWPNSAETVYYEGLIALYRDTGREGLQRAASSLERCLRLDPKHADGRYQYAVCLTRLGKPAEAERALKQVLKLSPSHRGASHKLAGVLRQQGKSVESRQVLEAFSRRDAAARRLRYLETQRGLKQITPAGLLELAGLYLDFDRPADTETSLREYQLREPTDPRGYRKLAQLYRRYERRDMAAAMQKLATALEAKAGGMR